MARRQRKTSAARVVAGLPVIHRQSDVLEPVYEADPDGRPVVHHRTVDTLGSMLRAGTITKDMHDAARDFQAQFTIARFDVVRCMPLIRLPRGGHGDLTDAQVDARRRVGGALDALGGLGSPAGSCVWHVVGLQRSIREWAMRQGWGGRPVRARRPSLRPVPEAAVGAVSETLREQGLPAPASAGGMTYLQARTANEVLKAQERKMRLQKLKGELVDRARATALMFRLARQERDAWAGWPARVAAMMAADLGIGAHAMQTVLETHVRQHLGELADLRVEFG